MNLCLGGKKSISPILPFCLPICLFYKEPILVVLHCKTIKKMCFFCLSCFRSSFSFPLLFSLLYICCHYILYHFFHILLFKYLICFPCDTKLFGHISLNILHLVSCVIGLTFCCFLHFLFPALFCCSIVYCLCLLCLLYFTNFTCSSVQTYTSNEKKKIPFLDWDHTCL